MYACEKALRPFNEAFIFTYSNVEGL